MNKADEMLASEDDFEVTLEGVHLSPATLRERATICR